MIFKLTAKGCEISENSYKRIKARLQKIIQTFPNVSDDLIVFRLNLKRNTDKYHPKRVAHRSHKSYSDSKPFISFFEGSIAFRLNKNMLYSRFKGHTIDESVNLGFERIVKNLEKHKSLHFPQESEYPDKNSIRKAF